MQHIKNYRSIKVTNITHYKIAIVHIQGVSRVMVVRRGYDSSSHSKTEILYTHMLVFALF